MAKTGLMASTSSFAHLLGLGSANAGKSKAETEDERVKREEQEREDAKKAGKDGGKAKAEGDDNKPDDQGEDESDEDYKERKRKEQEEDDEKAADEEDEKDEKDAKSKASRMRERARCAAIFASPAAGLRPDLAAHFAFNTNLSRKDAVSTLAVSAQGGAAPTASRAGLGDRMSRQANPDLGRDPGEKAALKPHQRILASFAMTQKPKA